MGQKVNPIGFRLPITRDWSSKWYASRKDFADYLLADGKIRGFLHRKLRQAAVSRIVIERAWNSLRVTIHTARPGVVIGRKGSEIEKMTDEISRLAGGKQVKIDIIEIKVPDIEAQLVAENVASQLATEQGALGIKIRCSGRLGGAEIARTEWYREGKIPLHTMRQPIDYGFTEASTVAGKIGIKCWICKKPSSPEGDEQKQQPRERHRDRPPRSEVGPA